MFTKDYEFRYSDLDAKNRIKPTASIDLLQDISICHSEHAGLGAAKMREMKTACLLEGWRIRFDGALNPYKKATVSTGVTAVTACEVLRRYEIRQEGELKISASAVWYTVNTEKMRIIRVPEAFKTEYECVNEPDNGLPFERFKPEGELPLLDRFKVQSRDLDTNNHVNNMKSAEIALCLLPDGFSLSELVIRYRKELAKDDEIFLCGAETDYGFRYELKNKNGDSCVMLKALGKQ